MYEVQKNIPIPSAAKTDKRKKYPFDEMDVGDSFFVANMTARALSNSSQWHANKTGKKFTCATEADGARCWRVA
jgi:hypothetical protein